MKPLLQSKTLYPENHPEHAGFQRAASMLGTSEVYAIGDPELLKYAFLGMFCSRKCPGDLILRAYDFAKELRGAEVPVIGSFQSSIEKDCLSLLLGGTQPVVMCLARSIDRLRIRKEWRPAIEDGRLLILSIVPPRYPRPTKKRANSRNLFVAAVAEAILIAHAAADSDTEKLAETIDHQTTPVFTLYSENNSHLLQRGIATAADLSTIQKHVFVDNQTSENDCRPSGKATY